MADNGVICSHPNCDRDVTCKGMCNSHYRNERARMLVPDEPDRQCSWHDCVRIKLAHGLCRNHLSRFYRSRPARPGQRACSVEGCDWVHWAKGYCRKHRNRAYPKARRVA
jgi:hypothetical protein